MEKNARIFVAGKETLIGAALARRLADEGYAQTINTPEPDYLSAAQVEAFFAAHSPQYVFLAAGRSAGIAGNRKQPAELMRDNLLTETHVIHSAWAHRVEKLLYLASSCSYPRLSVQPIPESALLTGALEPTNEAYAVAKIAGVVLCQAYRRQYGAPFIVGIPANAFGPGDNFSPEDSHVVASLMRRMHTAKLRREPVVSIWGSGAPRREFIPAAEVAGACLYVMRHYDALEPINLGGGEDLSIAELASLLKEITGYPGGLVFDLAQPDGMPRKALDSSKLLSLGWRPRSSLRAALEETYRWYQETLVKAPAL